MMTKEEYLAKLAEYVLDMEEDDIVELAEEYVAQGHDLVDGIMEGLVKGMNRASELYDEGEYFIPELLSCSDAMNNGIEVFHSHMPKDLKEEKKAKIVIGVVEGDTHDIGKDLVKIMLETNAFDVVDLGRDVPCTDIIDAAEEEGAEIIGLSSLMTTTMGQMKVLIDELESRGIRDKYKVIVGGAPISPKFAEDIGADGYSVNAPDCVKLCDSLIGL